MQRPFFHFPHIGYSRNPFGTLTEAEWMAIAVLPPAIEHILTTGFTHLQLLGPMGIGKSTTLLALQGWFSADDSKKIRHEYLPEGQRYFVTDASKLDVFILDEAQRLNWWQRRKLLQVASNPGLRLILSSHEDLIPLFARKGLALASVDLTGEMDEEWITAVLHKRLSYFALPNQAHATLTAAAITYLRETFGQNLRQMEYFLYEVWQRLETTDPIDSEFLRILKIPKPKYDWAKK